MNDRLLIYGNNLQAITLAIVMASMNVEVWVIDEDCELLDQEHIFKYDFHIKSLWNLYQVENRIRLTSEAEQLDEFNNIWIFVDSLSSAQLEDKIKLLNKVSSNVILSGTSNLGDIHNISEQLVSKQVFYVPFVFLKDSDSFHSTLRPHLLLIGEKTKGTYQYLTLIEPIVQRAENVSVADIKTIEFTRNSISIMLATRLSLMNELARLAGQMAVNINQVKELISQDHRIGKTYLDPGWGFGGPTLPLELKVIKEAFLEKNLSVNLIDSVALINEDQKELIFRKFWRYFATKINHKKVLIWGAGYKVGTGETINSAIHPLLELLWQYSVTTYVFDKKARIGLEKYYPSESLLYFCDTPYEVLEDCDAIIILNWSEGYLPSIEKINQYKKPVFDAQNLLPQEKFEQLKGFYTGIGQGEAI